MKTLYIVALVLALTAVQAQAKVLAISPNDAKGEIVLTDITVDLCGNNYMAYTTAPTATTIYGCWWNDERMVHITYDNYQTFRSYPINTFTRVE